VLQLLSIGGANQKAADSFLAAFFDLRPLAGREEPIEALEADRNSPVDYSSEGAIWRAGLNDKTVILL